MEQYSLKELRARNHLTQSEVAKILGISRETYNSWEADFGKVRIGAASSVADLLGVKIDEIRFS